MPESSPVFYPGMSDRAAVEEHACQFAWSCGPYTCVNLKKMSGSGDGRGLWAVANFRSSAKAYQHAPPPLAGCVPEVQSRVPSGPQSSPGKPHVFTTNISQLSCHRSKWACMQQQESCWQCAILQPLMRPFPGCLRLQLPIVRRSGDAVQVQLGHSWPYTLRSSCSAQTVLSLIRNKLHAFHGLLIQLHASG